jgi:hypothetical protein
LKLIYREDGKSFTIIDLLFLIKEKLANINNNLVHIYKLKLSTVTLLYKAIKCEYITYIVIFEKKERFDLSSTTIKGITTLYAQALF